MKVFILFILLTLGLTHVNAQMKLRCGTPHQVDDFVKNIDPALISRNTTTGMRLVKLYVTNFIEFRDVFNPETIITEVALMNEQFRLHNICFELIGFRTVPTPSTGENLYTIDVGNSQDIQMLESHLISNVLNMFIHRAVFDGFEEIEGSAYSIPNNYFSISSITFGGRLASAHEAGHCLGLYHTFHGNPGVEDGGSSCQEFVNGTNANTCGDFVQDTPADPYGLSGATITNTCVYTGTTVDPNSQPYSPNLYNSMSYWRGENSNCTRNNLTSGQGNRMQNVFIPGQVLATSEVSPIDITLGNSIVLNTHRVVAISGTLSAGNNGNGNFELHNTFGGYKASKIILKPGFRSFVTVEDRNFFFKALECQ